MVKSTTNPITTPLRAQFDIYQFYQSPLLRLFTGYKFLSSTFLLCGTLAVPALLLTGQQEGVYGAVAIGVASALPMTAQMVMVPKFVSRMRLTSPSSIEQPLVPQKQAKVPKVGKVTTMDLLDGLMPSSQISIEHFTLFGMLRSTTEDIRNLEPYRGKFRWTTWRSKESKKAYYVDEQAAGPILKKLMKMIEDPKKPEKWRTY